MQLEIYSVLSYIVYSTDDYAHKKFSKVRSMWIIFFEFCVLRNTQLTNYD